MGQKDITAVILAAGCSSRMEHFKPLLKIGDQTIIEKSVSLFRDAGVNDIRVVVGHNRELIEPILEKAGIRSIINEKNSREMFSSVLTALESLEPEVQAIILLPNDIPLVRHWTVQYLLRQHQMSSRSILIPCFQDKRGHPVVIPSKYFSTIRQWNGKDGLRGAFRHLSDTIVQLPVADANILFDIDTIEDYEEAKARWLKYTVPTRDECESILRDMAFVDESIYAHCCIVADAAGMICDALNRSGYRMDRELITAAGLLHDMYKGETRHDQKAANVLTEMGFPGVADIVAAHKDIECSSRTPVNGAEILYLADKLVKGNAIVSLTKRFQKALKRYGYDPKIKGKIEKRLQNAVIIKAKVEAVTGRTISLDVGSLLQEMQ